MNPLYKADCIRYKKIPHYQRKLTYYLRKCQEEHAWGGINRLYRLLFHFCAVSHGIEISSKTNIGKGFYVGHPYNITINQGVVIGNNCNIHKGALIGQENRGKRKGTPIIGDCVWIGINAVIVGNVIIGNDVLIAPNSFVNVNVPDHSIVFGNPCIIKHSDNATEGYINNKA